MKKFALCLLALLMLVSISPAGHHRTRSTSHTYHRERVAVFLPVQTYGYTRTVALPVALGYSCETTQPATNPAVGLPVAPKAEEAKATVTETTKTTTYEGARAVAGSYSETAPQRVALPVAVEVQNQHHYRRRAVANERVLIVEERQARRAVTNDRVLIVEKKAPRVAVAVKTDRVSVDVATAATGPSVVKTVTRQRSRPILGGTVTRTKTVVK